MNINTTIRIGLLSLVIAAAAGCHDNGPKLSINDNFRPDDEQRSVQSIFEQQAATGAREDGQLYAHHFTGSDLNSLGQAKLNAMFRGAEAGQVKIYLDVHKDDFTARESTVVAFLSQKGLASTAYAITSGPNLDIGTPAAPGLRGLAKQQAASTGDGQTPPANVMGN